MKGRSKVANEAFIIAKPVVEEMGFDLVDAEYKKEGQAYFLRLFIDKKGGISIDDCENVSRAVDPVLEKSLSCEPDYFEVSSPGATRPFDNVSDYRRHEGEEIEISLFAALDGEKHFVGLITKVEEDKVTVHSGTRDYTFTYEEIASAKRTIRFN
ncbi:MAG TPA: ribosome maturation factor RimP [Bacillota bacterium]|nr:ribosome maturation factor RimP [Bacillota bacterium]